MVVLDSIYRHILVAAVLETPLSGFFGRAMGGELTFHNIKSRSKTGYTANVSQMECRREQI